MVIYILFYLLHLYPNRFFYLVHIKKLDQYFKNLKDQQDLYHQVYQLFIMNNYIHYIHIFLHQLMF
jgi:hypothetical protein